MMMELLWRRYICAMCENECINKYIHRVCFERLLFMNKSKIQIGRYIIIITKASARLHHLSTSRAARPLSP